jgi:hypothetical protein
MLPGRFFLNWPHRIVIDKLPAMDAAISINFVPPIGQINLYEIMFAKKAPIPRLRLTEKSVHPLKFKIHLKISIFMEVARHL